MTDPLPFPATTPGVAPDSAFTAQQHHVINLIANGSTITEAAEAAHIHCNTVGNWRRLIPAFAQELDLATAEQSLYWHEQAVMLAPQAIDVLRTVLHNEAASLSLKLRAATTILKMAASPKQPMHKSAQSPKPIADFLAEDGPEVDLASLFPPRDEPPATVRKAPEPGRNSACPCGSSLKYKRCCGDPAKNSAHPPAHESACFPPSTPAPI